MPEQLDARLLEILRSLGITADMVATHVFRPAHLADASLHVELHEAVDGEDIVAPPPSGLLYRLDTAQLEQDLHALLSPCVAGYVMQLRRYSRVVFERRWQFARTPADGNLAWAPDVQMHVASVSKLVTAIAMTKLLHSRNISIDARIAPWLPGYWQRGPGVDAITFRQLLTHTSGLVAMNQPGPSDYQFMKTQIALGVVGAAGYRNMNYGLCRILLSTIDAPYLFTYLVPGATDAYWDLTTIRYYQRYVQENVFDPVGVASVFTHESDDTLAYAFPVNAPGWDSGDLSTMSGAAGWHLSIDDLLAMMANVRRLGGIIDPSRAQTMLDRGVGLDVIRDTALGRLYAKGGFWSLNGQFVEQSNAIFLPKGMELVILANSPLCSPNTGFMPQVLDIVEANIRPNWLVLAAAASVGLAFAGLVRHTRVRRH
jgi:CubicO group peptidase (beta-lactamase class C family)